MDDEVEPEDSLKKYAIMWGALLILSGGLMAIILVFGDRWLNFTLILMLTALKFISSFGIVLSVLTLGMKWLEKNTYRFKGKDKFDELKKYQMLLLVIPALLLIYKGPVKLAQSIGSSGGDVENVFDKLLFLYGSISLVLNLYLLPLFKQEFLPDSEEVSFKDKVVNKKENIKLKVKMKWYKFRKQLGKIQMYEQRSISEYLQEWKEKFSLYGLLALGLGMVIFSPIAVIFLAFWVRVFVMDEKELFNFERYFLIAAHIATLVIVIFIPFSFHNTGYYVDVQKYSFMVDIGAFLGLALGVWLYWVQMRNSDFKSWLAEKEKKYQEKEEKKEQKERKKREKREQKKKKKLEKKRRQQLRKSKKIGENDQEIIRERPLEKQGFSKSISLLTRFKKEEQSPATPEKVKKKSRKWGMKRKKSA